MPSRLSATCRPHSLNLDRTLPVLKTLPQRAHAFFRSWTKMAQLATESKYPDGIRLPRATFD